MKWRNDSREPGLERFKEDVNRLASYYAADETRQFVKGFALIFAGINEDRRVWASAARAAHGPILPILQEGMGGWSGQYFDSGDPNQDQTHHYAGLFFLGYFYGDRFASAVNHIRDQVLGYNQGDLNLGDLAAHQGAQFRSGGFTADQLTAQYFDALAVVQMGPK